MTHFGPRLAVLIYHRVLDRPDPLRPAEVDVERFERQMRTISRWYDVLPLRDAVRRLKDGSLGRRAVSITFDDGYTDNLHNAVPILQKHGLSASFFIATAYSSGGAMFNDLVIEAVRRCRVKAIELPDAGGPVLPGTTPAERHKAASEILRRIKYLDFEDRRRFAERLADASGMDPDLRMMMTPEQIRSMRAAGMEIGAHTRRHPILKTLPDKEAEVEIQASKADLEGMLQAPVPGFAYPNGRPNLDFDTRDVDIVRRSGFEYAVTTEWATAGASADSYRIPRISVGVSTGWRPAATILKSKLTG